MSIYGTWLMLDGDAHDVEHCDMYHETEPCCFDLTGRPCTCDAWKRQPIVYEGSHVLPSDEDRRGGGLEIGGVPDHITRDGRDDAPEGALKDWLRIGVWSEASTTKHEGKPYQPAGDATIVLTRPMVEQVRDALTAWLDRESFE